MSKAKHHTKTKNQIKETNQEQDTKFNYTVTPRQVYITRDDLNPSIVALTIGVSNDTAEDIACQGIRFTLALGAGKGALTNDPGKIQASSNQPDWRISKEADGRYRAVPVPPCTGITAQSSVTFQLAAIVVNKKLGTTPVDILEHYDTGNLTTSVPINKIRSNLNIDSFQGIPAEIEPGDNVTLSWVTTAAAKVTLLPGEFKDLETTGSVTVNPSQTTTYTLTAFGEGPSTSRQFTVNVKTIEILAFTASETQVDAGTQVTLSWQTENTTACTINPGNHQVPISGSLPVTPTRTTTYVLSAENKVGSIKQKNRTVTVNPVEIIHFDGTPNPFEPSSAVTLSWETKSATSCSITPDIGDVPVSGSTVVFPPDSTIYMLTANGEGGPQLKKLYIRQKIDFQYESILLRANLEDKGIIPRAGKVDLSPDVIPFSLDPVEQPQHFFSVNYGQDPGKDLLQNACNYIYLRGKNLGFGTQQGKLYLYYAPLNLLLWPSQWAKNQLKTAADRDYAQVSVDEMQLAVTPDPFVWIPQPFPSGTNPCLIGRVVTDKHPNPIPGDGQITNFTKWVSGNGGIGWRRVNIQDEGAPDFTKRLNFDMGDQAGQIMFSLTCTNAPVGSEAKFSCGTPGPSPLIDTPRTKVTNDSNFIFGITCDVPAGFQSNIYYSYWLNGHSPLPGFRLTLRAAFIVPGVKIETGILDPAVLDQLLREGKAIVIAAHSTTISQVR